MPKPKDAQGFDVAGRKYRQHEDPLSMLVQADRDYVTPVPSRNFTIKIAGERVTVQCHCYVQGMGDVNLLQGQLRDMTKMTTDYVSYLKKRVRELGGGTLKMKELKDIRSYDRPQTSQNDP